jgi:hypothetical protein
MKTKPAKLLMALLLGMGSSAFVASVALADDSKEAKDSKDSHVSASSATCTGQLVSACGLKVVKTTCTGSTVPSSSKDKDGKDDTDDSSHLSKDKDSHDNKNDRDRNDDFHKDHGDHSNDAYGNKISICHRMGGAVVSLTVANDGWASGHSKHDLDTIGRCADFDADKNSDDAKNSKDDKDKDHKISLSNTGYSMGLTTTQIACLNGSPGSTYTINGTTYPGAGLNSGSFAISIQSVNQGPSRGGARTLH